jgi:nitroreductase
MLQRIQPETLDVIRTRTSVRDYATTPIDDTLFEQMITSLLAAPTASNAQAWQFVAVRNPGRVEIVRAFSPGIIGIPPLIMVACIDHRRTKRAPGEASEKLADTAKLCVAMAVENLLLAAHALGLGGCPVGSFRGPVVQKLLNLPAEIEPVLVVPIGHPAQTPVPSKRRESSEVINFEDWRPDTATA